MTRIYFDTSVFVRPFDDQTQPRIWLETQAISLLLQMIEQGVIELIASSVVLFEISRHPDADHRLMVEQSLQKSSRVHHIDQDALSRALELAEVGIKAIDALHLACAELCSCDHFVTCDDRLVKQYRRVSDRKLQILDPVECVRVLSDSVTF